MKKTKRKGFNFMRSYFDVLNEIQDDKDKLQFLEAIINKQFLNEEPENLSYISKLCYSGVKHSISASVKGWEDKTKQKLTPIEPPWQGGSQGGYEAPYLQEKEKEKEKLQEKGKEKGKSKNFLPPSAEEVYDYFLEKDLDFDSAKNESEKFVNFYGSKGWLVGRSKMKNWKLAGNNWVKRSLEFKNEKTDKNQGKMNIIKKNIEIF